MKRKELEEYIDAMKTPAGGWTKVSLQKLGVAWPPPKGWRKELLDNAEK